MSTRWPDGLDEMGRVLSSLEGPLAGRLETVYIDGVR